MRSPTRIGEECPGGSGVRHTRFCCGPNSAGSPVVSLTPEPLGPRNRVQSEAAANVVRASRAGRVFMVARIPLYTLAPVLRRTNSGIVWGQVCIVFIGAHPIRTADPGSGDSVALFLPRYPRWRGALTKTDKICPYST